MPAIDATQIFYGLCTLLLAAVGFYASRAIIAVDRSVESLAGKIDAIEAKASTRAESLAAIDTSILVQLAKLQSDQDALRWRVVQVELLMRLPTNPPTTQG